MEKRSAKNNKNRRQNGAPANKARTNRSSLSLQQGATRLYTAVRKMIGWRERKFALIRKAGRLPALIFLRSFLKSKAPTAFRGGERSVRYNKSIFLYLNYHLIFYDMGSDREEKSGHYYAEIRSPRPDMISGKALFPAVKAPAASGNRMRAPNLRLGGVRELSAYHAADARHRAAANGRNLFPVFHGYGPRETLAGMESADKDRLKIAPTFLNNLSLETSVPCGYPKRPSSVQKNSRATAGRRAFAGTMLARRRGAQSKSAYPDPGGKTSKAAPRYMQAGSLPWNAGTINITLQRKPLLPFKATSQTVGLAWRNMNRQTGSVPDRGRMFVKVDSERMRSPAQKDRETAKANPAELIARGMAGEENALNMSDSLSVKSRLKATSQTAGRAWRNMNRQTGSVPDRGRMFVKVDSERMRSPAQKDRETAKANPAELITRGMTEEAIPLIMSGTFSVNSRPVSAARGISRGGVYPGEELVLRGNTKKEKPEILPKNIEIMDSEKATVKAEARQNSLRPGKETTAREVREIADKVYQMLEKRIFIEKERKGLLR